MAKLAVGPLGMVLLGKRGCCASARLPAWAVSALRGVGVALRRDCNGNASIQRSAETRRSRRVTVGNKGAAADPLPRIVPSSRLDRSF